MGDFEMINLKTGARLHIDRDGKETRDEVIPPIIEWCDPGQHFACKIDGQYYDDKIWACQACRK